MNNIAIRAENLAKRYELKKWTRYSYKALRDVLGNFITAPFRIFKGSPKEPSSAGYIWALNGVSFEIKQGEAIGIIGKNGSGKTTLLKVLSRITSPTKGRAEICGRVGSLLEVGTGFHPELTGRENIYLNGAILGMRKKETDRKFDEIVSFAEVEKFIDTPVKYFSSGMYMRLAFSVAAHMEPEILLVDEVLAVGDLGFQKKCLDKMDNVARGGRTVLFVSHNMPAIKQLCSRTILLNEGIILKDSPTAEAIDFYLETLDTIRNLDGDLSNPMLRVPTSDPESKFKWTQMEVINSQRQPAAKIYFAEPFKLIFRGHTNKKCEDILVGFSITSKLLGNIFLSHQIYNGLSNTLEEGITEFRVEINPNLLAPGFYEIGIAASGPGVGDFIPVAKELHVLDVGITPDKNWNYPGRGGLIDCPCKWSVKNLV